MKLIEKLRAEITDAMINSLRIKQDILKLVLGECQLRDKYDDTFVQKFAEKLVEANNETMGVGGLNQKLLEENTYLQPYLPPPKASIEEVEIHARSIYTDILGAKNDGQAIGLLSKLLKAKLDKPVSGDDLKLCVQNIRNGA